MEFLTENLVLVVVLGVLILGAVAGLLVRGRSGPSEPPPGGERPGVDDRAGGDTRTLELPVEDLEAPTVPDTPEALVEAPPVPEAPPLSARERFRLRLTRTRNVLGSSVAELFGRGVTDEAWEGLEEALITADVGVTATMEIVEELKRRSREEGANSPEAVLDLLKDELRQALGTADRSLGRATDNGPTVWLVTGVNGTGKTTTIGKLAAVEEREGRSVVLAAADTFRAAAADQL
jgi:fused signal recognition particle receptor